MINYTKIFQERPFEDALDWSLKLARKTLNDEIADKVETIQMISLIKEYGILPINFVHQSILRRVNISEFL